MSRAGDDAERSDEEERRMSVMNGREVARESRDAQVFEFGTAPGSAVVKIPVQGGPIGGIAISRDGSLLVVTNNGTDTVSVVGTDTCRVTQTVTSVNEPFAIAMGNAEANRAYVSTVSSAYDAIAVIDVATNTVLGTHPLALSVSDLTLSPDDKYLYVSRNGTPGAGHHHAMRADEPGRKCPVRRRQWAIRRPARRDHDPRAVRRGTHRESLAFAAEELQTPG